MWMPVKESPCASRHCGAPISSDRRFFEVTHSLVADGELPQKKGLREIATEVTAAAQVFRKARRLLSAFKNPSFPRYSKRPRISKKSHYVRQTNCPRVHNLCEINN